MAKKIFVTRNRDEKKTDINPITAFEWNRVVDTDESLIPYETAKASLRFDDEVKSESESYTLWVRKGFFKREEKAWFYFKKGKITAVDPDEKVIRKFQEIAGKLDAFVINDAGESY